MSPRRFGCILCAGIAAGFALAPAAKASIVANGDFGTGDFTGWTLFTTPEGSLAPLGSGLPAVTSFNVTGAGAQNAATFEVGSFDGTEQGGGITQTVTLPGGLISFSANVAALGDTTVDSTNAEGGVFNVLLDGVTEDTLDIGSIGPNAVIRGNLAFTATESAGPHSLEILITRMFDNAEAGVTPDQFITNIAITPAVPEPASSALLTAALLGFAAVRRRRG